MANLLTSLADIIRDAMTPNAGKGVSSTKMVWTVAGLLSSYCATLATVGGVAVYVFLQKADGVYWTGIGALWVNSLGFAAKVQWDQHSNTKDITIAQAESGVKP